MQRLGEETPQYDWRIGTQDARHRNSESRDIYIGCTFADTLRTAVSHDVVDRIRAES